MSEAVLCELSYIAKDVENWLDGWKKARPESIFSSHAKCYGLGRGCIVANNEIKNECTNGL